MVYYLTKLCDAMMAENAEAKVSFCGTRACYNVLIWHSYMDQDQDETPLPLSYWACWDLQSQIMDILKIFYSLNVCNALSTTK